MIKLFQKTTKLNIAILTNSIIYHLRQLPVIKKIVPGELYGNEGINALIIILTTLLKISKTIIFQLIYLLILVASASTINPNVEQNLAIVFVLVPLFSSFHYNRSFYASKEKFYAVVLMRIDANEYALMDFTKTMVKQGITSFIILLILSIFFKYPLYFAVLYPIYYIGFKTMATLLLANIYAKRKVLYTDKSAYVFTSMIIMFISVIGAISLVNQGYPIPMYVYFIIAAFVLVGGVICYLKLLKTRAFKSIFKKKLIQSAIMLDVDMTANTIKKSVNKGLSDNVKIDTNKKGFDFFNSVFFSRHKKILLDSSIKISAVYALILLVSNVAVFLFPDSHEHVYTLIHSHMPYTLFLMYFTNRGAKVTMAMFVNCDSSMLHYRFYKQPNVILSLFTQRLKTVVLVNLFPSITLSIGISMLLFLSNQDASIMQYIIIFIAINAISVFFSVHHLILYYLLQPYNENLQAKGFLFGLINGVTYMVCYVMMDISIPLFPFAISASIFCITYIVISLILAYRLAPKTFHLKN